MKALIIAVLALATVAITAFAVPPACACKDCGNCCPCECTAGCC